jgi:hypothetical protein
MQNVLESNIRNRDHKFEHHSHHNQRLVKFNSSFMFMFHVHVIKMSPLITSSRFIWTNLEPSCTIKNHSVIYGTI